MNTSFSIIMPAYNAEKTIKRSIESILKQTYTNWSLVVVDDGSIDDTYSIVKEIAETDSRIIALKQENKGPGFARNYAIDNSSGDYIAFLDSDDYWDPCFLSKIEEKINNESADIIFYDLICENHLGETISVHKLSKYMHHSKSQIIRLQMTGVFEWGMVKVIKRELVSNNNLRFSKNQVGEESVFSFDVLRLAQQISFVDTPIYHYIQSSDGQHKKGGDDPWWLIVELMKNHLITSKIFDEYEKTVNSFAFRALFISCYRCSQYGLKEARRKIKEVTNKYKTNYSLKRMDFSSLDLMSKIAYPFIRIGFLFPVIIAARLRGNSYS